MVTLEKLTYKIQIMTSELHLIIFGYCHTSPGHLYGHPRSVDAMFLKQ